MDWVILRNYSFNLSSEFMCAHTGPQEKAKSRQAQVQSKKLALYSFNFKFSNVIFVLRDAGITGYVCLE